MTTNSNLGGYEPIIDLSYLGINGALIRNNTTTPNTKFNITSGIMRDQSNTLDMNIGNFLGVLLGSDADVDTIVDATHVGANGIDIGELAVESFYFVYVIADTNSVAPTAGILSLNGPDIGPIMPFNYNAYRLVGYIATDDSAHFLLGYWFGSGNTRWFNYDSEYHLFASGNATTYTPVGLFNVVPPVENTQVLMHSIFTPSVAGHIVDMTPFGSTAISVTTVGQVAGVIVKTNSQVPARLDDGVPTILWRVSNSGDSLDLDVTGYVYTL